MNFRTIDEITVGDHEDWTRTITDADVVLYAGIIGDRGPLHLDESYAAKTPFGGRLSYGMLHAGYVGACLSSLLGAGSAYVRQDLRFRAPVLVGDTITVAVTVTGKNEKKSRVFVQTTCTRADGIVAIDGAAELLMFTTDL